MAKINLRPWREELRQEKQQQFLITFVGVLVLAFGVVFMWHQYLNGLIDDQKARNRYILQETDKLKEKIAEIDQLKQERKRLIDRMKVIQELQGNRPVIVKVFDELVRTIPDGIYYETLSLKGQELNISGVADSNNRISSLMRNFDNSEWFKDPNLTSVQAMKGQGGTTSNFKLIVNQTTPNAEEEEKAAKGRRKRS
ncbi:PilN domain-containing protein [Litoribrevibacter albus]|uniref:Pilus assembly protein PilN n=1 Tax=Litoribrevibacter albus TaxID=1473156 RepID=A0AA37SF70_9GAMM|nr:PilN domain-containing protein [Litoribrevibacter albus]GLQ33467.1 pilus assembly protein PilN [Litoribrevibacter albus]